MDFEQFITRLRKTIRDSYQQVGENMIAGGVKDMENYKYMLGQAHAFKLIDQEISNLLNPEEDKKNDTERPENVVQFRGSTED